MLIPILLLCCAAEAPQIHTLMSVTASSDSGSKYAPGQAIDGNPATRWATRSQAELPQWFELAFAEPVEVDTVLLHINVDGLYADWDQVRLEFSKGERFGGTWAGARCR